jgi:hypothetical protein
MSRSSIMPASLPSISPGWMPAWTSSTGLSGSNLSPSLETYSTSRSRPSGDWPKLSMRISGEAASSFSSQARVSA